MSGIGVRVRPESLTSPVAAALIAALNQELAGRFPEPGATHFRLDPEEVSDGRGVFLVAYRGDIPVGCGALRRLDSATAELKRMYVVPAERKRGVGRAILKSLEAEARRMGVSRLVLETGNRLEAALALYRRSGFAPIPLFGEYVDSPATSVCLGKDLQGG